MSEVEKDPAFEKLVFYSIKLSDEIYKGAKEWGSSKNRSQSQSRLNELLKGGISELEFSQVASELRIPRNTYYQLFSAILTNKALLIEKYGTGALATVSSKNLNYHIQNAESNSQVVSTPERTTVFNRQPSCPDCPFNNCGECSSGGFQTDSPTDGGGDDGPGCTTCKIACMQKRSSSRAIAQTGLVTALLGCGSGALGAAEQIHSSTFLLNLLGPEVPATAAAIAELLLGEDV